MALLQINDLIVLYGEIEALRGVSVSVDEGQVVTLLGANGAGKSTTLRAISGLLKPAAGDILFDGRSIAALSPEAVVRSGVVRPKASLPSIRRTSSTPLMMLPHWSEPPICRVHPARRNSSRKSVACISM